MPETIRRRSLVAIVALVTLLGAAAVVRAATIWTASNAPLAAKPGDAQVLARSLRDEQTRSGTLTDELRALTQRADELTSSLRQAQTTSAADATLAGQLRAKLQAAQAKLASLQRQLALAAGSPPPGPVVTAAPPPTPPGGDGGGDD